MSSILKALQKLEKDKAARTTREPDISTAIKMSGVRTKEYPAWLVPFIVVSVAAVSILLTFSLMGGFSTHRQTNLQTVQQPVQQQQPPSANLHAEPAPSPVKSAVQTEQPPSVMPQIAAPDGRKSGQYTVQVPPASPIPTKSAQTEPETLQEPANNQAAAAPEEKQPPKLILSVTGIAWQSDSASRIAVVNGISVSEGRTVGGAKVEQIFPDRVRFSQGGGSFEVFLNQDAQR